MSGFSPYELLIASLYSTQFAPRPATHSQEGE